MESDDELHLLVARAKSGDQDALSLLIRRSYRRVYQNAFAVLRREQDAEEATQEVFLRMYRKLHTIKDAHAFPSWLTTLSIRLAIDHGRKRLRERVDSLETVAEGKLRVDHDPAASAMIEEALSGLTPEQRAILLLRERDGYEYAEIADILHIPIGTVKSRLAYARQALRSQISQGR